MKRPRIIPKEVFERPPKTWNMTYEEYKQCFCADCQRKECLFYDNGLYRARMPQIDGGLGLCLNLKNNIPDEEKLKIQALFVRKYK